MAEAAAQAKKPGMIDAVRSLGHPKTLFMLLFGFASGLPFALFLGTLFAWLTEAQIDLETMGVFSLIGLAYAFQFLWSPLIDKVDIAGFKRLGRRKQWIVPAQILLGVILVALSLTNPTNDTMWWFSLLAGIGAIASATQDIAINAWRIDVADEKATLDILSTVYQMGYRLAALVGGALALIIAARIGWPQTYLMLGGVLLVIGVIGLFAPDGSAEDADEDAANSAEILALRSAGELDPEVRRKGLAITLVLWGWAIVSILIFMMRAMGVYIPHPSFDLGGTAVHPGWLFGMFELNEEGRPDPTFFTITMGPLIIVATIIIPSLIAGWLAGQKKAGRNVLTQDAAPAANRGGFAMDHLYRALLLPLVEFVGRMGWSLVLIISLVLTYRICDAIWGTFAYPFYLGELQYTNDDVAFASKFFGVGAIVLGLALGGAMITIIGRMATLTIGAVLAAATNLLYADLAVGGANMQAASDAVGFTALIGFLAPWGSEGIAKLTFTIFWENLSIGIAGAAYVAWLSSIVSKKFSAVQYALLSSLTLLVGTLGRGALGEMIENQGYFDVFVLTAAIGIIAVVLCLAEWFRQARMGRRSGVVTPDPQVTDETAGGTVSATPAASSSS